MEKLCSVGVGPLRAGNDPGLTVLVIFYCVYSICIVVVIAPVVLYVVNLDRMWLQVGCFGVFSSFFDQGIFQKNV